MENASKALIIAGSILVSIVLVTLGVMVINNMSGMIEQNSNLSPEQAMAYNKRFVPYEGRKSGSDVRTLLTTIQAHNSANIEDETQQVGVAATIGAEGKPVEAGKDKANANLDNIKALIKLIKSGKSYDVEFSTDSQSGYITAVTIKNAQ